MVKQIEDYEEFAPLLSGNKVLVVDCTAAWCGPCQRIAPEYAALAEDDSGACYIKVDVDDVEEFAAEYKITAMPTFIVFKDGVEVERVVGADISKVKAAVEKAKA
mmetsp:Transcript_4566/g.8620  ORF Transcript_4566/g.8620 Transcript_4566/m.8620 type:complete len:105 (+) Transcript_4566:170-484(+)